MSYSKRRGVSDLPLEIKIPRPAQQHLCAGNGGLQTTQNSILCAYCQDRLRDSAAIYYFRAFSERVLSQLTGRLCRLTLGLDHFGNQRNRVGVQALYGVPVKCFSTQQNRFTKAQIADASGVFAAEHPFQVVRDDLLAGAGAL